MLLPPSVVLGYQWHRETLASCFIPKKHADKDVSNAAPVVVVPCYNEAKRLNMRAIQDFGRRAESIELLFVNDGSRDETLELVEHLHSCNPHRFSFVHLAKNVGKAEAVRQGVLTAIRSGRGLRRVLGCRPGDAACGYRIVLPSARQQAPNRSRDRLANWPLGPQDRSSPATAIAGPRVRPDRLAGVGRANSRHAVRRQAVRATPRLEHYFAQPFRTRWIFDVEIFARMRLAHRTRQLPSLGEIIYEFPLDAVARRGGVELEEGDFVPSRGRDGRRFTDLPAARRLAGAP